MEIINPNTPPGNNARSCSTDVLAPPHPCYSGGCTGNQICSGHVDLCPSNRKGD